MRWFRWRVQLLLGGLTVLLLVAGTATWLTLPTRQTYADDLSASRLVALHQQGMDIQQARQAKVYAAEFAQAQVTEVPDCTVLHCIALTFDDGPNPVTTPQIVGVLESEHVPATFFIVGSRIAGNEDLLRRMQADGDEIGNHSWSHPDLTKLSADQVVQQIQQTQNAITAAGLPAPTLFRPPYGAINQTVRDDVKPLTLALWNEDPKDWAAQKPEQVLAAGEAAAQPGGVIDIHDIYHVTADSLQPLIVNLKSRNFRFVTMSDLMRSHSAVDGEFYGGYRP